MAGAAPRKGPNVRLDSQVQARLDRQRAEEHAALMRSRNLKLYVGLPALLALAVGSVLMATSDDATIAITGNVIASIFAWLVWKNRNRIKAALGFG
jgi:hypothetical protein